jgi:hypothetical protein
MVARRPVLAQLLEDAKDGKFQVGDLLDRAVAEGKKWLADPNPAAPTARIDESQIGFEDSCLVFDKF